jgi:predicted DNA-binding helix-hairpin-helix protein
MTGVIIQPDTQKKLEILSTDAQYDLACACACNNNERRHRGGDGKWIYPVSLPNGGTSILFKTLVSNVCSNDCKYCPLRGDQDVRRCSLNVEETANVFLDYLRQKKVHGLFLSSGVLGTPDASMEKLNDVARLLRQRHRFRGYIHLKIIPGASDAAIEEAVSLSSTVSLNIETPGEKHLAKVSNKKHFIEDIIKPIQLISRLTQKGGRFEGVNQTTQFIVGAADERDNEIVKYMGGLYDRLRMHRIYFSAYQRDLGEEMLGGGPTAGDVLAREHRLYQVDFLMRKYGFQESEIVFEKEGNLSLATDPKEMWARAHPERFPVNVNSAPGNELMRVPGLGPVSVLRILSRRRQGRIAGIQDIGKPGVLLRKANAYLTF